MALENNRTFQQMSIWYLGGLTHSLPDFNHLTCHFCRVLLALIPALDYPISSNSSISRFCFHMITFFRRVELLYIPLFPDVHIFAIFEMNQTMYNTQQYFLVDNCVVFETTTLVVHSAPKEKKKGIRFFRSLLVMI